ncbi:unnamed protein product [Effrenium voratum]|nr:unnamed protein product [Effrenium voratum]
MLFNATGLPHLAIGSAAHAALHGSASHGCAGAVAGDRAHYDLLLPQTPDRYTLEKLARSSSPGPAARRFMVSLQAQFVKIDVLGACARLVTYNTRHARDLMRLKKVRPQILERYKFALLSDSAALGDWGAGPNTNLWRILAAGAVPVYWGSPTMGRFLPRGSAIDALDFSSPLALAAKLQELTNDSEGHFLQLNVWRQLNAAPLSLGAALESQSPPLSQDSLAALAASRLRSSPAEPRFCSETWALEQRWLRECYGMLPAWVQSFDHHTLTATFERGSDGLRIEIAGGQDALSFFVPTAPAAPRELAPVGPRLGAQWAALAPLLGQRELFAEASVLQLGFTPEEMGFFPLWSLVAVERHASEDLEAYLKRIRTREELSQVLGAVLELLRCLLQHGVRHNDLWASNILVVRKALDTSELPLRLLAIDFEAAELLEEGFYDFWEESQSLGGTDSALSRARDFLHQRGVHPQELPPMAPSFHAFVGDGYSNAFEKWTDREMLAKVLDHHLGAGALAELARPFRPFLEALGSPGTEYPSCEDDGTCGQEGWQLDDLWQLLNV